MHIIQKKMRNTTGFTLIELMTALGIMAIITAITIPNVLGWVPDHRLKSAALDLFSMFQTARMLAIKNTSEYAIVFDTEKGIYQLVSGGPNKIYDGDTLPNDDKVEKTVGLSKYGSNIGFGYGSADRKATVSGGGFFLGDEVSYDHDTAEFNTQGMVDKMGYVYLQNSIMSSYAVATPTRAGVVTIKRWNGSGWE